MNERIQHKTLREETVDSIRKKILIGDIKQGDRIKEKEIADKLGVSRGLVREAFRQLEQEGVITYSTNKGCSVRNISADEVWEIYLLRANLETLAVKICKGKYSDETILRMEKAIEMMGKYAEQGNLYEVIKADQQFHSEIVLASKRKRLYELWNSLSSLTILIFFTTVNSRHAQINVQDKSHSAILDVIKSKDCKKICEKLELHHLTASKMVDENELKQANNDFTSFSNSSLNLD